MHSHLVLISLLTAKQICVAHAWLYSEQPHQWSLFEKRKQGSEIHTLNFKIISIMFLLINSNINSESVSISSHPGIYIVFYFDFKI